MTRKRICTKRPKYKGGSIKIVDTTNDGCLAITKLFAPRFKGGVNDPNLPNKETATEEARTNRHAIKHLLRMQDIDAIESFNGIARVRSEHNWRGT